MMRILPVAVNKPLNRHSTIQKSAVNFNGKTVNGHYYTDREYLDAMNYKDSGPVTCSNFCARYGFFEYVFTQTAERHAREVNRCISDIKVEEERAQQARRQRQLEFAQEQRRLQAQINSLNEQQQNREQVINSFIEIKDGEGLGACNLTDDNLEILKEEVLRPFAENKLNKESEGDIPNGVLAAGRDFEQSEKLLTELARKILKEDFDISFKKVQFISTEQFQNLLDLTKQNASDEYRNSGKRVIIYIPDFDKIAKSPYAEDYSPELNSFLKVYFLDCARSGCTIFASANDKDDIEPPFLINNERFKVVVDL